jgi:hypothetical protein
MYNKLVQLSVELNHMSKMVCCTFQFSNLTGMSVNVTLQNPDLFVEYSVLNVCSFCLPKSQVCALFGSTSYYLGHPGLNLCPEK